MAHELNINVGGMNVLRGLLEENLEDIKESVTKPSFYAILPIRK